MLYARGQSEITAEDVEAIVSDAAPSNIDDVIDHALLSDLPEVEASLSRFFHEGGDADYLIDWLIARLTLLHRLRLEMDQGRPFDAACQALFVRLPMSARRALARQAERWTSEAIAERLPAIRLASARVRTEFDLADVLATRALWTLASRRRGAETLNDRQRPRGPADGVARARINLAAFSPARAMELFRGAAVEPTSLGERQ